MAPTPKTELGLHGPGGRLDTYSIVMTSISLSFVIARIISRMTFGMKKYCGLRWDDYLIMSSLVCIGTLLKGLDCILARDQSYRHNCRG